MSLRANILAGSAVDAALGQAGEVEVLERIGEPVRYRLRYPLSIDAGDLPFARDGRVQPGATLAVHVGGPDGAECLVRGPVTGHSLRMVQGGAGAYVDVLGADRLVELDREVRVAVFEGVDEGSAARTVLQGYFADVRSGTLGSNHDPLKHALVQCETDLAFLRRLARRVGANLWLRCDSLGTETAYFERPDLGQSASAELSIHLDGANLDAIDLEWDVERATAAEAAGVDPAELTTLSGNGTDTGLVALGATAFADIATGTRTSRLAAVADDASALSGRAQALLAEHAWFLRARCTTSHEALGRAVRAHEVVDLRGAGRRYSGRYFVAAVSHRIDASAHRMDFELVRNAWEE